jgi:DNA-binding CsgD family transcriptional regulator
MTPDEARALLLRFDGRARHADRAGLSRAEEIALRLKAGGALDRLIEVALGKSPGGVRDLLNAAATKLSAWHMETAKDVVAVCDNKPIRERATFLNPQGEEEELRQAANAEDEKSRIHPDVKPTARELTAPHREALSVILKHRQCRSL